MEIVHFTGEDDTDDDSAEVSRALNRRRGRGRLRGPELLDTVGRTKEARHIAESLKSPLFGEISPEQKHETAKPSLEYLKRPDAAPESEAPINGLAEDEKREVRQETARVRKEQIQAELAQAEPNSDKAIEDAEVIKKLDEVEATGEIIEIQEVDLEEESPENEPSEPEALPLDTEGEIPLNDTTEDEPDDTTATATTPPAAGGAGGSAGSSGSGAGGAGGGAGSPPPGDYGGAGAPGSGFGGPTPPFAVPSSARTSRGTSHELYDSADVAAIEQSAAIRGFLVGGILGYLIGRRRGRIKTEKRLLPVQKKLEKEVKTLQSQVFEQEVKIRRSVRERLRLQRQLGEQLVPLPRRSLETIAGEQRPSRLGLEKPTRIERLGKAVMRAESPREVSEQEAIKLNRREQVRALNRNDLLELSEKIVVEGASLRQIYEQHLIGERGLRHLVSEYLQGKDIRRDLRREMVEREIDFERDPILRDAAYDVTSHGGASTSLKQMLEKANAAPTTDESLLPIAKLQAAAKQAAMHKQKRRRRAIDTAMVTLIVVLAVAVALLVWRHGF